MKEFNIKSVNHSTYNTYRINNTFIIICFGSYCSPTPFVGVEGKFFQFSPSNLCIEDTGFTFEPCEYCIFIPARNGFIKSFNRFTNFPFSLFYSKPRGYDFTIDPQERI